MPGVDVNTVDEGKWSPLASAAGAGHVEIMQELLGAGADANVANDNGALPLHHHKGRVAVISALLPHTRDVNCRDALGTTPLIRAVQTGSVEAARALIDAGASVTQPLRNGECVSLCITLFRSRWQACLSRYDDARGRPCLSRAGDTPLHVGCEAGHLDVCKLLIESGADMRATNRDGKIALELAHGPFVGTLGAFALQLAARDDA
jgi:26S proteasome non-ATPase regulatory subunit 10